MCEYSGTNAYTCINSEELTRWGLLTLLHVALLSACRLQLRVTLRCLHAFCLHLGVDTLDEPPLHSPTAGSRTLRSFEWKFNVRDTNTTEKRTHKCVFFFSSEQTNFILDFLFVMLADPTRKRLSRFGYPDNAAKKQILLHKTVCKSKQWLSGPPGWKKTVLESLDHKNKHLTSIWKQWCCRRNTTRWYIRNGDSMACKFDSFQFLSHFNGNVRLWVMGIQCVCYSP